MEIPGPNALRFLYGMRKRGFADYVNDLWHEYGDTFQVRLGPRRLIFAIHPDAVEHINVTHKQKYEKRDSYEPVRKYLLGDGLVASNGEFWRRQRKLMAPFFTPKGIQAYSDIMLRDTARLVERWEDLAKQGNEIEIADEMTYVTASIILKAVFSTESMESIHKIKDAVESMMALVDSRTIGFGVPLWIPTKTNRKYIAARDFTNEMIRKLIAERRRIPQEKWPDDLLARLMNARDEETGQAMSESLLRDESITMFFAGHETTARTMTFAWYALAKNPHVLARLHEEIDKVVGKGALTTEHLRQLPYALQIIKEVLRLYPPAPMYARDAIVNDTVMGYDIPAGAAILLPSYFTHRHPQFWDKPNDFDPDRWTREKESARHTYAYHPFATGQRICIGNNFSLLESHILLVMLAQRFTPKLRPGFVAQWAIKGTLGIANGLPMTITPR